MMQYHKYSLTEIENMIPWEKEIYLQLLNNHVKEENQKTDAENKKIENSSKMPNLPKPTMPRIPKR